MIQIIGRMSCKITRKAKRFFSDRGITFQDLDLKNRPVSPGELEHISRSVAPEALIDENGSYYKKNGYAWREYEALEEILEHPELLRTPVVRYKGKACCGDDEAGWKGVVEEYGKS